MGSVKKKKIKPDPIPYEVLAHDGGCDYGCPDTKAFAKCSTCGHAKHLHSPVHPHKCNCRNTVMAVEYNMSNKSCDCSCFTK